MPPTPKGKAPSRPVIGWREWVALPDLGVRWIKAKVDTGARSSAVHAFGVQPLRRRRSDWVRFGLHPLQRDAREIICEATLLDRRRVRNSGGQTEERFVIETTIEMLGDRWPIELTLTSRDAMGFRMLLGRQAVRRRFRIDPGRSYVGGRPAGPAASIDPFA